MDGAGRLATFPRITLPLLGRILLIAVLFRTLDALRAFDLMFVLTGGGPAGTTETLTVYAYRSLFQTLQLGFGSAVGVVVFALVMLVAWGYLRLLRREDGSRRESRRARRCATSRVLLALAALRDPVLLAGPDVAQARGRAAGAAAAAAEPAHARSTTRWCSSRA